MARIQALLEYYFIEFGNYPDSLKQMVDAFNQNVPASMVRIAVSADPATGKPFTYQLQEGGAGYSLSLPDPSRYDGQQFVMTPLDWGWMKQIAGSERRQRLLGMCKYNLNALATAVEMAALDRKGQFPKDLKELIGVFMEEEIICPQSGKPYVYKLNEDGKSFTISCPQPAAHNLRALYYDSVQGIKELKNQ